MKTILKLLPGKQSTFCIVAAMTLSLSFGVQADTKLHQLNIQRQGLGSALMELGESAGVEVIIPQGIDINAELSGISGAYTLTAALDELLKDRALFYRFTSDNTVVITKDVNGQGDVSGTNLRDLKKESSEIEELIITATRRNTGLQDTPMAISALGEENLQSMGAVGFSDFVRTVPGLTFVEGQPNQGNFVIRGITSSIGGGAIQSTVGLYIDDMPTLDTSASLSKTDLNLFDINRVEVLRGPQGTLFGSGSMGGAIRVITNKPDASEFAGSVDSTFYTTRGGGGSYLLNTMVNIPLIEDELAVRAVAYFRDRDGWVDDVNLGDNINSESAEGGRFMVKYQPTDALTLTGTLTYQNSEPEGSPAYNETLNGQLVRSSLVPEFVRDKFKSSNLVAEYDFGGIQLRSSTTLFQKSVFRQIEGPGVEKSTFIYDDASDNLFQEIHLFSDGEENFDWFLGGFYRKQSNRDYDFSWLIEGAEALYGTGPAGAEGDDVYSWLHQTETEERALFGEVSYHLTDTLEATAGIRYFENSFQSMTTIRGLYNGGFSVEQLAFEESKGTYKFLLSYTPGDDVLIYAQASQGYRVGNANVPVPDPTPSGYGPDELWNYELGAKTSWFDGRLQVNGALYRIDWKEMQLTQYTDAGWVYISNVGEVRSVGAELEVTASLSDRLKYIGAFAWNNAEMQKSNAGINAAKGDRVPGVAEFTAANTLEYEQPITDDVQAFIRADHQYVGSSFNQFNRAVASKLGGYHLLNMRMGAYWGQWQLALFVNNLLDDDGVVSVLPVVKTETFLLRPRTIGLNARYRF